MTNIPQIAAGLSEAQRDFLDRVAIGRRLKIADRQEDRVRQKMRRLGLVEMLMQPRRWSITETGQAVRQYLKENENTR